MTDEARTCHAIRVAYGNRAAIHVEAIVRDAETLRAVEDLNREGLVEFPQVDVGDGLAGAFQQLRDGEHRADTHFIRLASGHGEAAEDAERLEPELARAFV